MRKHHKIDPQETIQPEDIMLTSRQMLIGTPIAIPLIAQSWQSTGKSFLLWLGVALLLIIAIEGLYYLGLLEKLPLKENEIMKRVSSMMPQVRQNRSIAGFVLISITMLGILIIGAVSFVQTDTEDQALKANSRSGPLTALTPSPTSTPTATSTPDLQLPPARPTAIPTLRSTPVVPIFQEAYVINVVDGDTIDVLINEVEHRVQYLLIDAPEIKYPQKTPEPYGQRAFEINNILVDRQVVRLEKDVREKDKFGQLLRYVYLGDLLINEELLKRGLAQVEIVPPDTKYSKEFLRVQEEAQSAEVGMWRYYKGAASANESITMPTPSSLLSDEILVIVAVNYEDEYVEIHNAGSEPVNLMGWTLLSQNGLEQCPLSGFIQPYEVLRVWALAADADKIGYNCKFHDNIWRNAEPDPAVLYNPAGKEVFRLE